MKDIFIGPQSPLRNFFPLMRKTRHWAWKYNDRMAVRLVISGGKGTLMHVRPGADKTKNWTVGSHVAATDVTNHVLIMDNNADVRGVCANFF